MYGIVLDLCFIAHVCKIPLLHNKNPLFYACSEEVIQFNPYELKTQIAELVSCDMVEAVLAQLFFISLSSLLKKNRQEAAPRRKKKTGGRIIFLSLTLLLRPCHRKPIQLYFSFIRIKLDNFLQTCIKYRLFYR